MEKEQYDRQLIKWVKNHYWDSLEKDKYLILRHLRTFTGDLVQPDNSADKVYCGGCGYTHSPNEPCPNASSNQADAKSCPLYVDYKKSCKAWRDREEELNRTA